jgi:alkanesulfonate monooxygenase SsuD/methylene tetrahydromethanopterin reductase-like flavin-dependent oxidoreductase (luciferase family)
VFPINITFDMRAPDFGAPAPKVYETALEMAAYADAHGLDIVDLQEHHQSEDGYLPTPFLMGSAVAAATKRIGITLGAVILPLHDPVEIAEQIAVADLISGGRMNVILAAGYVEREFKAFGVSLADRSKRMDEGLEVITRALSGERFTYNGRPVFVRPLPMSKPPRIYVGGGVAASARRAAKFGLGFYPMSDDLIPIYEQECRKLGREPGPVIRLATGVHIYEDPEKGWAEIGENLLYYFRSYAEFSGSAETSSSPMHGMTTVEAIRASGLAQIVTPDQAVELAKQRPLALLPLQGGIAPETGWKTLQLFVDKVLPKLKTQKVAAPAE